MADGDLTTVAQVKTILSVRPNTVTDVGLINTLITGISQEFRTVLSRDLISDTFDEIYDGTGTSQLVLANFPIISVTSVEEGIPSQRTELIVDTDYVFNRYGIQRLCGKFPMAYSNIRVVYTAGYQSIPKDIELAAAKTVAYRYKQMDRLGQNSKSLANETVQFETSSYTKDVAALLENYKKRIPA